MVGLLVCLLLLFVSFFVGFVVFTSDWGEGGAVCICIERERERMRIIYI